MISKWRNLGKSYRVRTRCLKRKLYNTMLNYKSVSKCIMGLRDKVALLHTALCILFISQVFCMPKTKKNTKGINKYCSAQNRIKQEKLKIENNIEALFKKYKFPETEFATDFKPGFCYDFFEVNPNTLDEVVNNKNAFQKFKNKNARKIANKARKAHRNFHSKVDSVLEVSPRYSSLPVSGNFPNFPEVEYPMTATDIWKPNYWGDFIQPADNIQKSGLEIYKPYKINKKKCGTSINTIKVPAKTNTTTPTHNYTNEEICPISIYSQTTKAPYYNNFVIKDNSTTVHKPDEDTISKTTPIPIYDKNSSEQESDLPFENTNNSNKDTCDLEPLKDICFGHQNVTTSMDEKSTQDSSKPEEAEIELDEEFTTDEPEYAFAFSTPMPLSTGNAWKQTQVIDPYKSLSYPDELDDYFIAVKG